MNLSIKLLRIFRETRKSFVTVRDIQPTIQGSLWLDNHAIKHMGKRYQKVQEEKFIQ